MWTQEKVRELIAMFRAAPALWDVTCREYRDRNKQNEELSRIANILSTNVDELSRKIKSLKTQFRREQQKINLRSRSGAGAISLDKQWFGYDLLTFLVENNTSKGSRSNMEEDADKDEDVRDISSVSTIELSEECSIQGGASGNEHLFKEKSSTEKHNIQVPMSNKSKNKKLKTSQDAKVDEAYAFMKSVQGIMKLKDDYSVYAENMASRMRGSNQSSRAVAIAKYHIDNVLFRLEMGEFEETTHNLKYCSTSTPYQSTSSSTRLYLTPVHISNYNTDQQYSQPYPNTSQFRPNTPPPPPPYSPQTSPYPPTIHLPSPSDSMSSYDNSGNDVIYFDMNPNVSRSHSQQSSAEQK